MTRKMYSIFRFEGLMVFHYHSATSKWEVGILNAGEEAIRESAAGMPPHKFDVKDNRTGRSLIKGRQYGKLWSLGVRNERNEERNDISANGAKPVSRHDPNGNRLDVGWLINLKEEFHPDGDLQMQPDKLTPIIRLNTGHLYTCCKTDGISYYRESEPWEDYPFGFIAESIGLAIETEENETIVLYLGDHASPILLKYRPEGYRIDVENVAEDSQKHNGDHTTAMDHEGTHGEMPDETNHFQLYYNLLFPWVDDKCHIQLLKPAVPSPNPCAMDTNKARTIPPYKCGGILMIDADGWNA